MDRLIDRGLTEWSDRELRQMIARGRSASAADVRARLLLADSLHDRQRDGEAGEVLKELMDAADKDANVLQQIRLAQQSEMRTNFLRARMYFYFACDAGSHNDTAGQREFLDKAIEQDPTDLDVLIAIVSGPTRILPDGPSCEADQGGGRRLPHPIEESPDEPIYYNELAWLVANTEGDIDEAIRLSQKSVELVRAEARSPEARRAVSRHAGALLFRQEGLRQRGEVPDRGRPARPAHQGHRPATEGVSRGAGRSPQSPCVKRPIWISDRHVRYPTRPSRWPAQGAGRPDRAGSRATRRGHADRAGARVSAGSFDVECADRHALRVDGT